MNAMTPEQLLARALEIAVAAHAGQTDRQGLPYITHPLRVMARVQSTKEKIVAVLHDVVEDPPWTLQQLREAGFPPDIVHAIDCVTKREGELYEDFVTRSASDAIALRVKLADLEDNMDIRRQKQISAQDLERFNKYLLAYHRLSNLVAPAS
jgi:(p)ppGpp synthase/HD superfamily hydrolase